MIDFKQLTDDLHPNEEQKKVLEEYYNNQTDYLECQMNKEATEFLRECSCREENVKRNGNELLFKFLKNRNDKAVYTFKNCNAKKFSYLDKKNKDFTISVNDYQFTLRDMFLVGEMVYIGVYTEDYFYFAVPIISIGGADVAKILKIVYNDTKKQYNKKGFTDCNFEEPLCCNEYYV